MAVPENDDASFDPKTWTSPRTASSTPADQVKATDPGGEDEAPSFDLRGWAKPEASAPAPQASPNEQALPMPSGASEVSEDSARRRRTMLLAGGSGIAILLLGAVITLAIRQTNIAQPAPEPSVASTGSMPAAPDAPPPSRRTLVVNDPGEILGALTIAGIAPPEASAAAGKALAALGPAVREIRLSFDIQGQEGEIRLLQLEATHDDGSGIALTRLADGGFAGKTMATKLETRIKVVRGELDANSFYTSAVTAGVTDSLIGDFANAFSFDFDMQREVAPGDVFEAAFEQAYNPSGEAVGVPKLLYVSLNTAAKSRALYRFIAPGEKEGGWYDGNGHSTVRALMRTPVDSARISSAFGMRLHPVLGYMKLHEGTDFAAPVGTPIYASGNAVVEWAAMKGANGNLTVLRHDNGWQTFYLHQKLFLPGIVPGARVHQGQQIGEIGLTGRTTGPHLHYALKIDGQFTNPQMVDTGTGKTLAGKALIAFNKERDRIDARRAASPD